MSLFAADNLDSSRHMWILVFVPLVFISLISIPICIWSIRHDRSYELELFCAVNMLQFIFLALKLDRSVHHIKYRSLIQVSLPLKRLVEWSDVGQAWQEALCYPCTHCNFFQLFFQAL